MKWKRISQTLGVLAAGIGAIGLLGWIFGLDAFKRIHPALVTMKANTAVCLMLAGAAVALLREERAGGARLRLAQICAVIIALVGALTFAEHVGGWDWGIDQALFRESVAEAGRSFPGRMGPASALNFMLLGLAVLMLDAPTRRGWSPAQICAAAVAGITFLIFLAYFYGVEMQASLALYASIALHTVVAFLLLCAGLLLARPDRGMMAILLADNVGGIIARRMLPAALLLPGLIGWVCALGRDAGYYGKGVGTALLATAMTLIFTVLVSWAARALENAAAQRRRAQEDLLRSERELADFFENAAVSLHWVGPDGAVLRVNDAELAMLGYTREEYVGRPIADFHADEPVIGDILARLTAGETLADYPARLRCKDGSLRDVLIHSSVYLEDGKFIHTRCFTRDVTEFKRAEAARYRLAAIVESSEDAIIGKNLDGMVTSWNAGAQRLFGYSAEEMIGQPILRVIPPDRHAEEGEILRRQRAGERVEHFETVRVTKDGRPIDVSLTISPIRDSTGGIIGVSKIARDITQRKHTEAALEQQRQWFAVTLSSIGDAVIATDAGGAISFLNPVAEAMTGWSAHEAIGRPLLEVFRILNEKTRAPASDPVARVLREGIIVALANHTVLLARDGREIAIEDSAAPIKDAAGTLVGAVLVFHDVTERRQAEEAALAAREAVEAASRAKDEFLAALSHELRTPLTPVLLLSAAMERSDELPADVRKDFGMIRKNVELEARIIDDLLDLTRITQGKLVLRVESVDPHALVEHALEILRSDIDGKQITVALDLAAADHHVNGDPVRLQQVFWNILKNAVKFTPPAGRITIRSWNADGRLRIATTDTGLGITPEEMPRIFDSFGQGDEAAEPRFGGLGLGLSISSVLVREHRGRIWAESPGREQGATFHVELPLAGAPASAPASNVPPPAAPKPLRILLVEDHQATRETLARLLARRGHEIASANGVAQALALAGPDRFDMVISDLGLPDGHGHDLMRALRRDFGLTGIALSGYGMEADIQQSKDAGFQEHLTKPVDIVHLETAMQRIIAARDGR